MTDFMKLLGDFPEINPANYGDDDVNALNAWGIAAHTAIEELQAENASLLQQAQIWKQEAMAQRATVHEAYRVCTGNTGEPGDWNGAEPIRKLAAERDALQSENERLKAERDKAADNAIVYIFKCDDLQAKLDALQTQEPLPAGLERCEFDDECDYCSAPEQGTYTRLTHNAEDCTEVEFYVCGACLAGAIPPKAAPKALAPLTNDEIFKFSAGIFGGGNRYPRAELELARAIEAAHGIGGTP